MKSTLEATEREQVGECKSAEPREVLLLYSRESAEINQRVAELRLKLQRDHHMKVLTISGWKSLKIDGIS